MFEHQAPGGIFSWFDFRAHTVIPFNSICSIIIFTYIKFSRIYGQKHGRKYAVLEKFYVYGINKEMNSIAPDGCYVQSCSEL